jgi:UDP-N-acetylmuramate dehydrogenase
VKTSAAWLIEHSGITKGQSLGGARISTKHVLALTNSGGAKASEIAALAKLAHEKVRAAFNISLEPEVNLVGLNLL